MNFLNLPLEIIITIFEVALESNIISVCHYFHQMYEENIYNIHMKLIKYKLFNTKPYEISYKGLKLLVSKEPKVFIEYLSEKYGKMYPFMVSSSNRYTSKHIKHSIHIFNSIFTVPILFHDNILVNEMEKIFNIYFKKCITRTIYLFNKDILTISCCYNNTPLINKYYNRPRSDMSCGFYLEYIIKNDNLEVILQNSNFKTPMTQIIENAIIFKSHRIFNHFYNCITLDQKNVALELTIKHRYDYGFIKLLNNKKYIEYLCSKKCDSPDFKHTTLRITQICHLVRQTDLYHILRQVINVTSYYANNRFRIIIPQYKIDNTARLNNNPAKQFNERGKIPKSMKRNKITK